MRCVYPKETEGFLEKYYLRKALTQRERIFLAPLTFLSRLYSFLVQIRCYCYQKGILKARKLSCKVISIGNITLGGTGKTPAAIYIAGLLKERGKRVAVLSRGYKGKNGKNVKLVSDGASTFLEPGQSGDEPYLLAERLKGVPVVIGKDRFLAGQYAISQFSSEVVILDDGFQHLRLKRDLDIVLIDITRQLGNGHLIPRGILRESPGNLSRASLFILTHGEESGEDIKALKNRLTSLNEKAEIFTATHEARFLFDSEGGEKKNPGCLKGKKVMAVSGIANPQSFASLLTAYGAIIKERMVFPDHHYYSKEDIELINERSKGVDIIVTTEKDWVKLKGRDEGESGIMVLRIDFNMCERKKFENLFWELLN